MSHKYTEGAHQGKRDRWRAINIQLDDENATRLRDLAERTHVNPGTLARSLPSQALDEADSSAASIVVLLDSIPGALEKAYEGLREGAGKGIPLDEFQDSRATSAATAERSGSPAPPPPGTAGDG
jgi:hypothetical protein